VNFLIKGNKLKEGRHELSSRAIIQGSNFADADEKNNKNSVQIIVVKKSELLEDILPILKWVGVVIFALIVVKIISSLISQRGEDYLR